MVWLALLGGVVLAAVGVGVVLAMTVFAATVLDGRAVERDATRIVVDAYGQPEPTKMTCPPQPAAEPGTTFSCDMSTKSGVIKKVPIQITSADGRYRVGLPGRSEL